MGNNQEKKVNGNFPPQPPEQLFMMGNNKEKTHKWELPSAVSWTVFHKHLCKWIGFWNSTKISKCHKLSTISPKQQAPAGGSGIPRVTLNAICWKEARLTCPGKCFPSGKLTTSQLRNIRAALCWHLFSHITLLCQFAHFWGGSDSFHLPRRRIRRLNV